MFKQRSSSFALAAVAMLIISGAVLFSYRAANAAQDPTIELVAPDSVTTGQLITVKVVAHNVRDVGGFQATVQFDPAQLHLTGATVADDLKRSGRDVLPLGPVLRSDSVVLGAVTCPASNCADAQPQRSFLRMLSGSSGDVDLGDVSFFAQTTGSLPLALSNAQLVDPQGARLPVRAINTTLTVAGN